MVTRTATTAQLTTLSLGSAPLGPPEASVPNERWPVWEQVHGPENTQEDLKTG